MLALFLGLATSLAYGVSNFVGPLISRTLAPAAVLVAGQLLALLASALLVVLTAAPTPGAGALVAALVAGLGNALGLAGFYKAAATGPISIAAPLSATSATVPVVLGLAGGEQVAALQLGGIVLAVLGASLAARREPGEGAEGPGQHDRSARRRTVVYALLSALGFGVFLYALAPASAGGGVFWAVAISRASFLASIVVGALLLGQSLRVPVRALPLAAVPGLLLFAGTLSYSFATTIAPVSVVSVLGSLFPVVTVTLALVVLRERPGPVQRVGIAAALVGVVLLST